MIRVEGLAKRFGEIHAVRDVSFTAPDGSITGLLGPNGAGKTTTLRVISTLMAPSAGTAAVDGVEVTRDRLAARLRIGMLSDARGIYARLTARENIAYYGALHGMARDAVQKRVEELARSEERRVGKEGRRQGSEGHENNHDVK